MRPKGNNALYPPADHPQARYRLILTFLPLFDLDCPCGSSEEPAFRWPRAACGFAHAHTSSQPRVFRWLHAAIAQSVAGRAPAVCQPLIPESGTTEIAPPSSGPAVLPTRLILRAVRIGLRIVCDSPRSETRSAAVRYEAVQPGRTPHRKHAAALIQAVRRAPTRGAGEKGCKQCLDIAAVTARSGLPHR